MDQQGKSAHVVGALVAATVLIVASSALANPTAINSDLLRDTPGYEVIQGIASFYDIPGETASGEQYDPTLFTAAAQIDIRDKFGGIKFGFRYQPVYAIAEYAGKRAILKFNDVGPLRPGRKFDLSRAAMQHFGGIERGLLPDFKVTLLPPGKNYTPGPLRDESDDLIEAKPEDVIETKAPEVIEAQQSAPTDAAEVTAQNDQVEDVDSDHYCVAGPSPFGSDDAILTGSTHMVANASGNTETMDNGSFDETLPFNRL
jgi:rare lipoprotein A